LGTYEIRPGYDPLFYKLGFETSMKADQHSMKYVLREMIQIRRNMEKSRSSKAWYSSLLVYPKPNNR